MTNSLENYEKYMLSTDNMNKIPQLNSISNPNSNPNPNPNSNSNSNPNLSIAKNTEISKDKSQDKARDKNKNKSARELTNQSDKLFWCFYIILNGDLEYELDHSYKKEKEFKIESIERLRKIKSELKAMKLRLNEIEDELLNCRKITIKSLVALCLLHKINLVYVWNRKYFEFINDAAKNNNVIINDGFDVKTLSQVNEQKLDYYRKNYWCVENIEKPLKALTSYSKDELFLIINKLEVKDVTLKSTKKVMYENILEKI